MAEMNSALTESTPALPARPSTAADRLRRAATRAAAGGSDLLALTKARANAAVAVTALVGFGLHAEFQGHGMALLHVLAGTGLLAAAAAAANQAWESEHDRKMSRTRHRPVATGRIPRSTAVAFSLLMALAGSVWLGLMAGTAPLLFALMALFVYVLAYTPLKRCTPACLVPGAVSGALPVLVGWAATGAACDVWTFTATATIFVWQSPHFLAIAWWRRADYMGAGYHVLPAGDEGGQRTAGWALGGSVLTALLPLAPWVAGAASPMYAAGQMAVGAFLVRSALQFRAQRTTASARALFVASLFHLPAAFGLMLLGRWSH